jgi:hypothetical protein
VDAFFAGMAVLDTKDLGVVSKFFGIGFEYDAEKGWLLEQRSAIQELLDKFGLSSPSATRVPIGGDRKTRWVPKDGVGSPERPTVHTFQSLVDSLL